MKFILLFTLLFSQLLYAQVTRPFNTDLCTGYPEGTPEHPMLWAHCCKTHDLYFWAGGTREQRKKADQDLYQCVKISAGEFQARLIYLGVTAGSFSPWKLEGKQWGNAWGNTVRKLPLTQIEIEQLGLDLMNHSTLDPQLIEQFIRALQSR